MTAEPISCPACATPGRGRFCCNCGASLSQAHCTSCGSPLAPGARFCSNCRESRSAPAASAASAREHPITWIPWAITGVALIIIAFFAGQRLAGGAGKGNAAQAPLASGRASSNESPGVLIAPDITRLSLRERVDRLYDRIMRLDAEGKKDSVQFFANMAIPGYGMLPSMDDDLHYDLGRVEEVAGALVLARAQADTILRSNPTHLLGLALGMRTARALDDSTSARAFAARLLAAAKSERAKALPEYERHANDITNAMKEAKRR